MRRFAVGADEMVTAGANAPITKAQALKGRAELAAMRQSLGEWLKYRAINDAVAAGKADQIPSPLLKRPGAKPSQAFAAAYTTTRGADEQKLAAQLHQLLSEVFDPASLPSPDLTRNPNAAVALAKIAIAGQLPGDPAAPQAQGMVWLWPLVIVVGAIAFVITTAIRSSADEAKERERLECIKAGKCTDTGFFLKLGAVVVIGWFAWDKLGVGHKVKHAMKGGRG